MHLNFVSRKEYHRVADLDATVHALERWQRAIVQDSTEVGSINVLQHQVEHAVNYIDRSCGDNIGMGWKFEPRRCLILYTLAVSLAPGAATESL
jgi:hypothetical protein